MEVKGSGGEVASNPNGQKGMKGAVWCKAGGPEGIGDNPGGLRVSQSSSCKLTYTLNSIIYLVVLQAWIDGQHYRFSQ